MRARQNNAMHAVLLVIGFSWPITLVAEEHPHMILQIYREPLKPGGESAHRAIEEDTSRVCANLGCPHPFLALESLSGPKEVWWLNTFESEAERQRVTNDYENNGALMAALRGNSQRKASVTGSGTNLFVRYRKDLSGAPWKPAGARFFVVTVTRREALPEGSVFEAPDGARFIFRALAAHDEAKGVAQSAGPEATVFAVRPYWGMPAKEWIAAEPEFWKLNPLVGQKTK